MILLEHIANPGRIMCKGNRSGLRHDQSGNHGKERRFAAAARTDDCKKFPFRNREGYDRKSLYAEDVKESDS